jgi:hypothetical protein
MDSRLKKLLLVLGVMLAMVPLGLLTDAPAWGEWDLEFYKKVLGFIPKGMEEAPQLPHPLPDYSLPNGHPVVGYYISGVVGVAVVFLLTYLIGKAVLKKRQNGN